MLNFIGSLLCLFQKLRHHFGAEQFPMSCNMNFISIPPFLFFSLQQFLHHCFVLPYHRQVVLLSATLWRPHLFPAWPAPTVVRTRCSPQSSPPYPQPPSVGLPRRGLGSSGCAPSARCCQPRTGLVRHHSG